MDCRLASTHRFVPMFLWDKEKVFAFMNGYGSS